jgi:hypothetical protein
LFLILNFPYVLVNLLAMQAISGIPTASLGQKTASWQVCSKGSSNERQSNAGLPATRECGVRLEGPRILDRHLNSVAKLSQKGLSGRRIAAELDILAGPVFAILRRTTSDSIRTMRSTDKNDQLLAVILSARNF